jgi:AcrR family transcriptional regulator
VTVAARTVSARGPRRRTQAERRAVTRERILAAATESLAEVGFQRSTAAEITRRAGVTWGAVQHHFGDKDGILRAVLEASFARFAARVRDVPAQGRSLDARIHLFVERAWEHFGGDDFRSTFEILLNHLPTEARRAAPTFQARMGRAWDGVWRGVFGDVRIPARERRALERYTFAALAGLAFAAILRGEAPARSEPGTRLLEETLRGEMARWVR